MLAECKLAMRIMATAYDAEIAALILAGVKDMAVAGIPVEGVSFTFTASTEGTVVIDTSTITDQLLIRALITYARLHFGSPDDYDRLERSYNEQKAQLQMASGYGRAVV